MSGNNKRSLSFHFFAVITILGWACSYVLTKLAMTHFSAMSLGFLRYITASAILAAVVFALKIRRPDKKDRLLFVIAGAFGFSIYMVIFNIGTATVTSATSSTIIATTPIWTAILARIVYKEKLRVLQWLSIFVSFAGILVLSLGNGVLAMGAGVPWLLLAALSFSTYNLIQRKLTRKYSGLQASIYSIFAGTVLLAFSLPAAASEIASASFTQIVYVISLGVFPSAVGYAAWSVAAKRAPNLSSASNYLFLTPFIASLFGFALADEVPDAATLLGGALVISGMIAFSLAGRKQGRAAPRR
ncbi:membrane protein [Synergistales bacterium]|nr:membrane protein [Synergistales bacterium]